MVGAIALYTIFSNNFLCRSQFLLGKQRENAVYREIAFSASLPIPNGRFIEKLLAKFTRLTASGDGAVQVRTYASLPAVAAAPAAANERY